jgi:hypothetical protein
MNVRHNRPQNLGSTRAVESLLQRVQHLLQLPCDIGAPGRDLQHEQAHQRGWRQRPGLQHGTQLAGVGPGEVVEQKPEPQDVAVSPPQLSVDETAIHGREPLQVQPGGESRRQYGL